MADFLSIEAASDGSAPTVQRAGNAIRAKVRRTSSTFTFASQAAGSRLLLPKVPKGAKGVHHRITVSVTTATATLALGIAGNTTKYGAAVAYTTADTPTSVAKAANLAAELAADEDQFLTVGTAALPAAGTLVVETFFTIFT